MENIRNPHEKSESESTSEDVVFNTQRICVGKAFQAVCPELEPVATRRPDLLNDKALLLWAPSDKLPDNDLEMYIALAKEKYGYTEEQALAMMLWHNHDVNIATQDLPKFKPFPDEWSVEDSVIFEQAFRLHGKNFARIREILPDKTIGSLVQYYYSWKKTKFRTSKIEKQVRKLLATRKNTAVSSYDSDSSSSEKSDSSNIRKKCGNCGVMCKVFYMPSKRGLCYSCYQNCKRAGPLRPTLELESHSKERASSSSTYFSYDDLVQVASGDNGNALLNTLDGELISIGKVVQENQQTISELKEKLAEDMTNIESKCSSMSPINTGSTNEEVVLAVQDFHIYEENCNTVSEFDPETQSHIDKMFRELGGDGPEIEASDEIMESKDIDIKLDLSEMEADNDLPGPTLSPSLFFEDKL